MQNPAQNDYSVCAACRMQDAGCRIGPQMDSSAWCRMRRMQNAGCKIRPKEFVRWVQLTALSPILHPASASCILHRVQARHLALGPILHSAFCICILHRVPVHSFGPDSAFCILHLHPAWVAVHSFVRGRFCIPRYHLLRSANGATRPGGRT